MSININRREILKLGIALPFSTLQANSVGNVPVALTASAQSMPAAENGYPQIVSLDGLWNFAYDHNPPKKEPHGKRMPEWPKEKEFAGQMPVPGYWDEHYDFLRSAPFWAFARFNPLYRKLRYPLGQDPPDAMLPYLMGVGWYRKVLNVPEDWKSCSVILCVGGARVEAWVWLNKEFVGHHIGHSVPFELSLDQWLEAGKANTLIIALDNTSDARGGTSLRGYQGRTAGFYRPVSLKVAGGTRITSCYLRPVKGMQKIVWTVDLESKNLKQNMLLKWKVQEPGSGRTLGNGVEKVRGTTVTWQSETFGMRPWSDHDPALYTVVVTLANSGTVLDQQTLPFGMRLLEREGTNLRLNGRPIMLRGTTDHYYFPVTTMAPSTVVPYRDRIRKLKEMGFNWIRFHTWVPHEEEMQAADELGMMIQIEAPVGFAEQEWIDIIKTCRVHPSVVLYCPGNEEYLDENKIAFLRTLADLVRQKVPDALFNPQSALRGVEYSWGSDKSGLGPGAVKEPFPYNPGRLNLLKQFSDVYGSYAWSMLSYTTLKGDWHELDKRMKVYERPILSHELGIIGNYLNLDLEHRFEGTRIGPALFAAVRHSLKRAGLLDKAELYYRNSCAWTRTLRKENLEMARKVKYLAGYDFLGAFDQNWLLSGYPCGITNDFFEMKPGEEPGDVRKYNGESVVLLDYTNHRNFLAGETLQFDVLASLYGHSALDEGTLRWYLRDQQGNILARGSWQPRGIQNGMIEKLGAWKYTLPMLEKPTKATLVVELSGGEYELTNNWDFWIFPKPPRVEPGAAADRAVLGKLSDRFGRLQPIDKSSRHQLRIVSDLDHKTLDFLNKGGRVLLLGNGPFPTLPTSFQMSVCGRVKGNLATIINDHPAVGDFPHEGYCSWQFYSLLKGGNAVNFNDLPCRFDPIIEVASSFKLIFKQANLFEFRVGKGRLLVSTMNTDVSDPATAYLLGRLIEYSKGKQFLPRGQMATDILAALISKNSQKAKQPT